MGHRRNRKRERRFNGRGSDFEPFFAPAAPMPSFAPSDEAIALYFLTGEDEPRAPVVGCGTCVEFVEDSLTGRGECLHPGSGILRPWSDTPACDFHTARRRR